MKTPLTAFLPIISMAILLTGCAARNALSAGKSDGGYKEISQDEAKRIMDTESGYVIIDAREQDEYDAGHIPGAVLMPVGQVSRLAPDMLGDKEQLILVYCRSGRRSKAAAQTLADMGYTNVKEFGGIMSWPYETVK